MKEIKNISNFRELKLTLLHAWCIIVNFKIKCILKLDDNDILTENNISMNIKTFKN